jgi:capsular exopolysaccharide synthesis family protein
MAAAQNNYDLLLNPSGQLAAGGGSDVAPTDPPKKGLNPAPLLRTVRRNILLIAGIATIATVIGGYLSSRPVKIYQGSFRILVEPISSQGRSADPSAISRSAGGGGGEGNTIDYATLLQVLQSPAILEKISDQVKTRYPEITGEVLLKEIYGKNLSIRRVGTDFTDITRLIEVVYKGRDPQQVEFVLQEMKNGYLRYSLEDRRNQIGGGIEFIEDQLPSLQKRVSSLESSLQSLRQEYRLTDPTSESGNLSKQLQDVRAQRLQTERELKEQQATVENLQQQLSLSPTEALAAASLTENPRYQELVGEIKKLDIQIAATSARLTDEFPRLKSLKAQRERLTQLLSDETDRNLALRLASGSVNPQVLTFQNSTRLGLIKQLVDTSNSSKLLEVRSQAIAQAEANLDRQFLEFPGIIRRYNDIQKDLEIATKTLDQFLTQRETLRIEVAQKDVPWEVISAATLIKDANNNPIPADAGSSRLLLMGLAGGLLLGLATAFLLEKLKNVFFSSDDIPDALRLPLLGVVPFNKDTDPLANPASGNEFAKAFSSMYTNLRFLSTTPPRSLLISSAVAREGKTLVALNLAMAAVSMGQRVLLVDANLRQPQLHAVLNLPNQVGLSDVLSNEQLAWEEAVERSSQDKNLSVLVAGQGSSDASRLLASTKMQKVMSQLHTAYDLVIYDTPNLSAFPDTTFLATQTDGIVMVVSVKKVKQSTAKRVLAELKKFRLPVLGVVPNHPGRAGISSADNSRPYEELYQEQPALLEGVSTVNSIPSRIS